MNAFAHFYFHFTPFERRKSNGKGGMETNNPTFYLVFEHIDGNDVNAVVERISITDGR